MWNPTKGDCNCNRACKIHGDLGNETCSCLQAFNLLLTSTETSPGDKKKKNEKKVIALFL